MQRSSLFSLANELSMNSALKPDTVTNTRPMIERQLTPILSDAKNEPNTPWQKPFGGTLIALLLLMCIEALLHTDAFLYRYRSVFAAGRAMDKVLAFEAKPTTLLILGNSRVDNGVSPDTMRQATGLDAFNLGLPGAEACNIEGVVLRLDRNGVFAAGRTRHVLFGLDEGFFQRTGGLGYEVYFDDRERLLAHDRYRDWLRSAIRLWGYADSLRTLQEPAKFVQAVQASLGEVESWGGNASRTSGFRAADEVVNQDASQIESQAGTTHRPPDPQVLECFWATTERLKAAQVGVSVFFTPALHTSNAFNTDAVTADSPYSRMKGEFIARGIGVMDIDTRSIIAGKFFANPGHLNRKGATQFTTLLAAHFSAKQQFDSSR